MRWWMAALAIVLLAVPAAQAISLVGYIDADVARGAPVWVEDNLYLLGDGKVTQLDPDTGAAWTVAEMPVRRGGFAWYDGSEILHVAGWSFEPYQRAGALAVDPRDWSVREGPGMRDPTMSQTYQTGLVDGRVTLQGACRSDSLCELLFLDVPSLDFVREQVPVTSDRLVVVGGDDDMHATPQGTYAFGGEARALFYHQTVGPRDYCQINLVRADGIDVLPQRLPLGSASAASVSDGDHIFFFGGWQSPAPDVCAGSGHENPTDAIVLFDPATLESRVCPHRLPEASWEWRATYDQRTGDTLLFDAFSQESAPVYRFSRAEAEQCIQGVGICDIDPAAPSCDPDNDGHVNAVDNCDFTRNLAQEDHDADGVGNLCDPDLPDEPVGTPSMTLTWRPILLRPGETRPFGDVVTARFSGPSRYEYSTTILGGPSDPPAIFVQAVSNATEMSAWLNQTMVTGLGSCEQTWELRVFAGRVLRGYDSPFMPGDERFFDSSEYRVPVHVSCPAPARSPVLTVSGDNVAEGETARLAVRLDAPVPYAIELAWDTGFATAEAADFEAGSGTLTLGPGATEAWLEIPTRRDGEREYAESFTIHFSHPIGASLASPRVDVVIFGEDVEPLPTVRLAAPSVEGIPTLAPGGETAPGASLGAIQIDTFALREAEAGPAQVPSPSKADQPRHVPIPSPVALMALGFAVAAFRRSLSKR